MRSTDIHFESDTPIASSEKDLCNWAAQVDVVASLIHNRDHTEPFCIGIHGPWGSGKSSFVNLVKERLKGYSALNLSETDSDKPPLVMDFRPWIISGQESILSFFFNELIGFLGKDTELEELVKLLIRYQKQLESLASGEPASFILVKTGLFVLRCLKRFRGKPETIIELKQEIVRQLGGAVKNGKKVNPCRHVVIFIDDIDRLLKKEMIQIFQLVKAVADFPNVTFVLVYEQDMVLKCLERKQSGNPREYLEKLVQVSTPVPRIPEEILLGQMNQLLVRAWGNERSSYFIPDPRSDAGLSDVWSSLCDHHILKNLKSFRQVKRFINNVHIHRSNLGMDVDIVELSHWSWLCTIQPDLPERVSAFRDKKVLRTIHDHANRKDKEQTEMIEFVESLADGIPSGLASILPEWFNGYKGKPIRAFENSSSGSNPKSFQNNLDRVLRFNSGMNELWSPSLFQKKLEGCKDAINTALIWAEVPTNEFSNVLMEWKNLLDLGVATENRVVLTTFLIQNGDNIDDEAPRTFMAFSLWERLYRFILKQLLILNTDDTNARIASKLLNEAMRENPKCLDMPLTIVSRIEHDNKNKGSNSEWIGLLTNDEIQAIKTELIKRCKNLVEDSTKYRRGLIVFAGYRLFEWGMSEDAKTLVMSFGNRSHLHFAEILANVNTEWINTENEVSSYDFNKTEMAKFADESWWKNKVDEIVASRDEIYLSNKKMFDSFQKYCNREAAKEKQ